MKPTFSSILLPLILCLFSGCEYNLKEENNLDIDKPSDTRLFDLNLIAESDTILIYGETNLIYNANGFGLEIKKIEIRLDSTLINPNEKTIRINPDYYTEGFHNLSIAMLTNSGTGSIADKMGIEGYKAERKWVLYINRNPDLNPKRTITPEGYLKISWSKLKLSGFQNYSFRYYANNRFISEKTYSDINQTSFIDSSFVGGTASFHITLNFINRGRSQGIDDYLSLEDTLPKLQFEDLSADSLRISWKRSKYKAKFKLVRSNIYPSGVLLDSKSDTSVVVAQEYLGNIATYNLFIAPLAQQNPSWDLLCDSKYHNTGTHIAVNWPDYGYNQLDKVFYTNSYNEVECYDVKTLKKISTYRTTDLLYHMDMSKYYSGASNSTKIAVLTRDSIFVFFDKTLKSKVSIPYNARRKIDYFYLTDNDLVAVASSGKYDLISLETKSVTATLDIADYPEYSTWASISTSKDGQYICIVTRNGTQVYRYAAGAFSSIYSGSNVYRSAMFSISNPGEVYLTSNESNDLEIRSIPDFNLIKKIYLPSNRHVVRNIDPETGNLFTTDYDFVYVLDRNTNKTIFRSRIGEIEYRPLLFHNTILSITGYAVNISKFIN